MTDKELKFRILIKYICINDLVHLEASFVRHDFCMVSAFSFQKKKATILWVQFWLDIWLGNCFTGSLSSLRIILVFCLLVDERCTTVKSAVL